MAAASPAQNLQDEATCSICLDYFQDPVMIVDCGHNFCRACITKYRKGSNMNISCPQCRMRFSWQNLKPNRHLGNIVEAAKQISFQLSSPRKRICTEHKKALNLFCEKDKILICVDCGRMKAHQGHRVVSTKEAAADYKVKLRRHLENLKKDKKKIQTTKSNGEKPSQELLKETQAKRQEIVSEFQQQVQFLKEQEQFHLAKLEVMEREIQKTMHAYANKFEDEVYYITNLIGEIEKKGDQPADEFLEDITSILERCENRKFQFPDAPDPSDVKKRLNIFSQESTTLQTTLRTLRETMLRSKWTNGTASKPNLNKETAQKSKWIKENVLLDPETAHPRYIVSPDRKSVTWGDARQMFPYSPKRFENVRCVLGDEGFTSGKHYWTVDVGDGDYWAVGVALESVERQFEIDLNPDEGIWAFGLYYDQYKALTSPPTLIEIDDDNEPTQIQVSLNYGAGTVAFYDAEDKTRLFIFESVDFKGERVFPFFRITNSSTCLQLCSVGGGSQSCWTPQGNGMLVPLPWGYVSPVSGVQSWMG
ncbi:zinc finger protein RFP-like [Tiliqua scincoides]|uniref:zinc finger protein RFP-like n=1 Tax=Tiliqua scincoides TaxID=71010 RepID=UPI003461EF6F